MSLPPAPNSEARTVPSTTHHVITALESFFCEIPPIDLPAPYTSTISTYARTPRLSADEDPSTSLLAQRISKTSILITTTLPLQAPILSEKITPYLKLIVVMASGINSVDLEACRRRGIRVVNSPGANTDAVSEHALSLYFAARRKVVDLHLQTMQASCGYDGGNDKSLWEKRGSLMDLLIDSSGKAPLTCGQEVVGIVGHGGIGKRIAHLCHALGMSVLISERRGVNPRSPDRTAFDETLRRSTVLMLSLPLSPESQNLISPSELRSMHPNAVLINVSRGGIVDEAALLTALNEGWIAGAATDVFSVEPAGPETSPLLGPGARSLANLTVSPHLAWLAESTLQNLQRTLVENIVGWVEGKDVNVVV